MAIDDKHPEFVAKVGEWIQMEDTYKGERAVKRKRLDYLPPSEAMIQDGMTTPSSPGWRDYDAYLTRAYYHDVVRDAVKAMLGIMHMKPAVIKLPPKLAPMADKATLQGEGLQMLLRRINEAQLVKGRCGLLVDAPTGVDPFNALPYIAFYDPERIINWDTGRRDEGRNILDLVVIDESGFQREGFTWVAERKHRILTRGTPESLESGWTRPPLNAPYQVCVKVNDMSMPIPDDFIQPSIGGRAMTDIPFVFCGANDLVPEPDEPPLLGLSNLALAIYRAEADYRSTLFYQGQQTLVIIGGNVSDVDENQQLRIGNKGVIDLRIGGDAKYIGVSAAGLGEMRQSLKADCDAASGFGVSFMDVGSARGASGEALRIRVAARTTTIQQIAVAAGAALEQTLKYAAVWCGEDPSEVSVEPQTDFADANVQGASLLAFMQAKQLGLPLSLKSLHRMMMLNDITEMDFEQENDQIEQESESMLGMLIHGPAAPDDEDASFLDTTGDTGTDPVDPSDAVPTGAPVPITPHTRGSPVPGKSKLGKKGASAGK